MKLQRQILSETRRLLAAMASRDSGGPQRPEPVPRSRAAVRAPVSGQNDGPRAGDPRHLLRELVERDMLDTFPWFRLAREAEARKPSPSPENNDALA